MKEYYPWWGKLLDYSLNLIMFLALGTLLLNWIRPVPSNILTSAWIVLLIFSMGIAVIETMIWKDIPRLWRKVRG